jgi:hypothetical protein
MDSTCYRANGKRIVGFALKSRLPSVYNDREAVDAGGLMSYGADLAESHRRRVFRGQNPEGEPSAPSCP